MRVITAFSIPSVTARLRQGRVLPMSLLLACMAAAAGGCSSREAGTDASDSIFARDLALAQSQRASDAAFQDTVITSLTPPVQAASQAPQPRTPRVVAKTPPATTPAARRAASPPVTAPPGGIAQQATAPAASDNRVAPGTSLQLVSGARVCTVSNRVGDQLVATVNAPIMSGDGMLIPTGSLVHLEVAELMGTQSESVGGRIKFRVVSIDVGNKRYTVNGDVYTLGSLERSHVPGSDPNAGKKKVIAGAVLGGVLGGVLGHDAKGTVLGAAAGAAAGAAVAQASKDYEDCLPASSPLQLTLSSALLVT